MTSMRRIFGVLMVTIFAAFALPAAADSDDKFSLALSPLAPAAQAGPITFIATIKNLAKYDYVKSFTITVPSGYTISGTPTSSSGTVSPAGQVVSVSGVQIATNKTVQVTIKASSTPACGTKPASTWTATAKGGLFVNNEVFTLDSATAPRTTTITPLCYTVSGSSSAGGVVTCGPSPVAVGGGSSCSVAINPGYSFTGFTNCTPTSAGATTCTVSNVQANVTVSATFSQIPYAINITANPPAGGVVSCNPTSVNYDGSSTCSVTTLSPGYSFAGFTSCTATTPGSTTCTVSKVRADQNVIANFTQIPYTVTGTANPTAGGGVSCTTVTYGQNSTCTATTNTGYTLTDFTNCTPTAPGSSTCTVSNVQGNVSNVTANFSLNTLTIGSPQSSAAVDAVYTVVVKLVGPDAMVTLTPTGCPTLTGGSYGPTASAQGQVNFSLTYHDVTAVGACSLRATATSYLNPSAAWPITVFAVGDLGCSNVPTDNSTIDGSPGLGISDPGYAKGYRGAPWKGDKSCLHVNWTFTNNVLGGHPTDPNGNTVPVNGVSFLWDQQVPNTAYSYTVTWAPEWFGLSAANRKTQYCGNAGCTLKVPAQICLSPALVPDSLPPSVANPANKDPVCISAEVWGVVPSTQCTGTPGTGQTACVIVTTTITDIGDPPIIRDN